MGAKQSSLKKELDALKDETQATAAKHKEELDALRKEMETATAKHKQELDAVVKDKQELEHEVDELQKQAEQARREVESTREEAQQREERMQALKWELVRQMRLSGACVSPPSTRTSGSGSLSPRASLHWKLKDDVAPRQSATSPKPVRSAASGYDAADQAAITPGGEACLPPFEPPTAAIDSERREEDSELAQGASSPNQTATSDTAEEGEQAHEAARTEASGYSDVDGSDDASEASSSKSAEVVIVSSSAGDEAHEVEDEGEPTENPKPKSSEADDVLAFSDEEEEKEEAGRDASKP